MHAQSIARVQVVTAYALLLGHDGIAPSDQEDPAFAPGLHKPSGIPT